MDRFVPRDDGTEGRLVRFVKMGADPIDLIVWQGLHVGAEATDLLL